MKLPEEFLINMKTLLGAEYDNWLASMQNPPAAGLRINTMKLNQAEWEGGQCPYRVSAVPWTANGYYLEETARPAKHPYYYAGLYYLQEPSAMAPAGLLPVKPGDMVLDLCAAPGGKSTELGARLQGKGLLVANDISNSRARALLKNLELFGIPNICVTSEAPDKLAEVFGACFDCILVDAPCSGEGMFRKDPDLMKSWEEHGPEYYAPHQREILAQAVTMLKPGGYLLYSTCTFAKTEDEDTIDWLLSEFSQMELTPLPLFPGAASGVDGQPVIRMFPHKIRGEGHFVALLQKRILVQKHVDNDEAETPQYVDARDKRVITTENKVASRENRAWQKLEKETDFLTFWTDMNITLEKDRLMVKQEQIYYLPVNFNPQWKLRYLRTGLLLGEVKKGRFEPSQALAMALKKDDFASSISFTSEDERVVRYLKGETISLETEEIVKKGWCLVCVDNFPLGWAKCTGTTLKNKYYPGWRWQ